VETNKRTDPGQPYLSWCIISRNSGKKIEDTLKSLRERTPQAEIVIVDTMSSLDDPSIEIGKRYADVWAEYKGPKGNWDREMPWFTDAADARQHSFELASGTWRGWIDADDILPGPEEVERLLKINGKWIEDAGHKTVIDKDAPVKSLEDMLREVQEKCPEAEMIYAPYLYQRDSADRSLVWQERERICLWNDNWQWMERSHEVLCPKNGHFGRRVDFSNLLFVHEKDHNKETHGYALARHFDVLHEQYKAGEITTRRSLYLSAYAAKLCPDRQAEFIDSAHAAANTPEDRYRAKVAEAEWYIARGLYRDVKEALGAATSLMPHLPDAWIVGAQAAVDVEDWLRADEWFTKALKLKVTNQSLLQPRHMIVWYPVLHVMTKEKIASLYMKQGDIDSANAVYDTCITMLVEILNFLKTLTREREQVAAMWRKIRNIRRGNQIATWFLSTLSFLAENDEPLKALKLIEAAPAILEDHPYIVEMENWCKRISTHYNDEKAYEEFYRDSEVHGIQVPSPIHLIDHKAPTSRNMIGRAYWTAEYIKKNCPNGRVLDLGCFDGLSAIPLLQECPDVQYVGVDLNESAHERIQERFAEQGWQDRTSCYLSDNVLPEKLFDKLLNEDGPFDVVIWFEVIEHVPDVQLYLALLKKMLKPNGKLVISTPWGPLDDGAPPSFETRDPRGHLRAMTPRNFINEMDRAQLDVVQIYNEETHWKNGNETLHAMLARPTEKTRRPVTFAVCAGLWDWNDSVVRNNGMGASEETIAYLGVELAKDRLVEVYGQVPEEEVQFGVRYWGHNQMRKIHPDAKVIVSRAPHWGTIIDEKMFLRDTEKLLWLQDATYPDLNPDIAAYYEKIVCVGEWQRQRLHEVHKVPLDKMTVIGNFLLKEHFEIDDPPEREPHHFIYASSPDRGLITLLTMWPQIRELYPDATLDIFYGWRGLHKLGSGMVSGENWVRRFEDMRRDFEAVRWQDGINERGMINHTDIAREFMRASAWLYPSDFGETFCSNAIKSRAAGCIPVTSDFAALGVTAKCDQGQMIPFEGAIDDKFKKAWLDGVVAAVETPDADRAQMSAEAIRDHSIETVLPLWEELLR
jgi:2-polyprenyl-3-methyl-5-hydroxy-6-metoxy-1,4-benzoquinol methylase/glycosyltransferase involved in cell wall biosynthesis